MDEKLAKGLAKKFIRDTTAHYNGSVRIDDALGMLAHRRSEKPKFTAGECQGQYNRIATMVKESGCTITYIPIDFEKGKLSANKFDRTGLVIETEPSEIEDEEVPGSLEKTVCVSVKSFRINRNRYTFGIGHTNPFFRPHFIARLIERSFTTPDGVSENFLKLAIMKVAIFSTFTGINAERLVNPVVAPTENGLALGYSFLRKNEEARGVFVDISKSGTTNKLVNERGINSKTYLSTFISKKEMNEDQTRIWELLNELAEKHWGMMVFHMIEQTFGEHVDELNLPGTNREDFTDALREYIEITKLPEFSGFNELTRKGQMNKQVQAALEISDEKYKGKYSGENLLKAADDLRQREKVKKLMEGHQGGGFKP